MNIKNYMIEIFNNNNKKSLKKVCLVTMLVGSISLVGCSQSQTEDNQTQAKQGNQDEQTVTPTIPETVTAETAGVQGKPVRYDVASWQNTSTSPIQLDELQKIQKIFGKVTTVDENSLDYVSSPATKYRFMPNDAAYLDIIDSQKYLEVGWYYANPDDNDNEKSTSQAHAKKAYQFARQLMGEAGGKVVADMLGGQVIKNKTIDGTTVELAKCEFYSCMLIINKPDDLQQDSK